MVRIALVQLQLLEDASKSMKRAIKLLKNAAKEAGIACLPEQWYPRQVEDFEYEFKGIIDIAKEHGTTIIPGAFLEKMKNGVYISCPVIGGNDHIIGRQFKIHPFGNERTRVKSGTKLEIFTLKKYRFGIAICHDIVFPEVSRAITLKGADLIFYPSRIKKEGIEPWHLYVQVRALENRVPIVAPNACSTQFGGKSIIVDFEYDKKNNIVLPSKTVASVREQVLIRDVDVEHARKIRKIRFEDVKSNLYRSL